ncbi:MAG: hypothetical protein M1833_003676 [Piccolia ochrophora]|nr:MAG: hypothetical protein M1833_003676 [Piccolia ochrophora]
MRLSRFTHHRRLFRAFDELGLTKDEILGLCRWEGTRWARESYERQENIKVRDTTGDEIPEWTPRVKQEPSKLASDGLEVDTEELDDELQEGSTVNGDEEESEEEIESVGIELNQRLSAAAEARERGADVVMDEAWEQWLKEASERGTLTDSINALRAGQTLPPIGMPLNPSTIPRPTTAPTTTSTAAGTALS